MVIDFSPLSSLGQLTSLSLSHTWRVNHLPAHRPSLSMGMLPASLQQLDLCPVTIRDTEQLQLPHLTWLSLEGADSLPRETELLPQLPQLKVRSAAYPCSTECERAQMLERESSFLFIETSTQSNFGAL